jgi:hypothetical protein
LAAWGASPNEAAELLAYFESAFDLNALGPEIALPLPDEPFVAIWERWAGEARERDAWTVLHEHLPQLHFPIALGMSQSEAYRAATLRGVPPRDLPEATGIELARPERVALELYSSPAGRIPLILVRGREEFVALVRALGHRNEPVPVPQGQGALIVGGYNNWARIDELRRRWEALDPAERKCATWNEEFDRIRSRRELYQDRFLLLSDGPYSGVPAAELGLGEQEWRELSLVIRRDHECAHYFTRRLFGSMRNHLLDELIADYAGMVAAVGRYRADWFLRFLGLYGSLHNSLGARIALYRGDPPLSDGAFRALGTIIRAAAESLERFDERWPAGPRGLGERALMIAALASLRLDVLAAPGAEQVLERTLAGLRARLGWRDVPGG